jgi:hypothetical protein
MTMHATAVHKDERTLAVENASYRWGFQVMSFGLLLLAMYRSLVQDESPWDLMALVVFGGAVPIAYQARKHVLTGRWVKLQLVAIVVAAVVAALIVFVKR